MRGIVYCPMFLIRYDQSLTNLSNLNSRPGKFKRAAALFARLGGLQARMLRSLLESGSARSPALLVGSNSGNFRPRTPLVRVFISLSTFSPIASPSKDKHVYRDL